MVHGLLTVVAFLAAPGGSEGKVSACNVGDPGFIPGSGRSPGEGNGNPLQHSYLENAMDRGAWQARVHRIAKSLTGLKCLSVHTRTHNHQEGWRGSWHVRLTP